MAQMMLPTAVREMTRKKAYARRLARGAATRRMVHWPNGCDEGNPYHPATQEAQFCAWAHEYEMEKHRIRASWFDKN